MIHMQSLPSSSAISGQLEIKQPVGIDAPSVVLLMPEGHQCDPAAN